MVPVEAIDSLLVGAIGETRWGLGAAQQETDFSEQWIKRKNFLSVRENKILFMYPLPCCIKVNEWAVVWQHKCNDLLRLLQRSQIMVVWPKSTTILGYSRTNLNFREAF